MSTLRVSNIEAKADPSSPSIDEKLKVTNSNGDVLVQIDGKTAGITTFGVNSTGNTFSVDNANNVVFSGIVTATKFSLSGGGEITGGDGNFTGIVTAASIDATSATFGGNVSIAGTLTYEDVTSIDSVGIITAQSDVHVGAGLSVVGISTLANTTINGQHTATNARITGITTFGTSSITINGAHEYPSIRPVLDFNFAATKTLDRRITFTRDSIGTFTDENGLVKYASNNVPRFDHDPTTGESLGLLIEGSGTNLVTYSQTFSNWVVQSGASITLNQGTAPDGTNTAVKLIGDAAPNSGVYVTSCTVSTSANNTKSIYLRSISGTATCQFKDPVSTVTTLTCNLTTTWQRFSFSETQSGGEAGIWIDSIPSGGILAWGAQVENNPHLTSYIPTSGTTVTRAADTAKITGTNFTDFYNETEGTLVSEHMGAGNSNASPYIAMFSDGTNNERNILMSDYAGYQVVVIKGGATQAVLDAGTPILNVKNKNALAFKKDDFALSLNGGTVATDTSGNLAVVDQLWIGSRNGSDSHMNNTIQSIKYYNKRLPNAQLQGLTAQ